MTGPPLEASLKRAEERIGRMADEITELIAERDGAREELRTKLDSVRYAFRMVGLDGGPGLVGATQSKLKPGFQFSLAFENGGTEPLRCEVEFLAVSVGRWAGDPKQAFLSRGDVVFPGALYHFWARRIVAPIDPPLANGVGEYVIRYGHPSGGPRFQTHHKFSIGWVFSPQGQAGARYTPLGQPTHDLLPDGAAWSDA